MIKAENEVHQLKNGPGERRRPKMKQVSIHQVNAIEMALKFKLHILECKIQ